MTLEELFELQATFNKRVGLDDIYFAEKFGGEGEAFSPDLLIAAGKWIDDMLKALTSEMEELRNCTYWKHWCSEAQAGQRYKVKDVVAARKEVIDMLHFWISLAQVLGMTPEITATMYRAKLTKNLKRQDAGYSIKEKDMAWYFFLKYPNQWSEEFGSLTGESIEDLPEKAQARYLDWAKRYRGEVT
jgi:hypothetical protein